MFYIYKITNIINQKTYYGYSFSPEDRFDQHLLEAYNSKQPSYNTIFHRAIRKHGWHNFTPEIVYETGSEDDIKIAEEYFIRSANTHYKFGFGYNMTYGGEGTKGVVRSSETLSKMSKAQMGKNKSPETLKKLFDSMLRYGDKIAKNWEIIDPSGKTFSIKNLRRFCIENNLDQGNMMKVVKGTSAHCKGYKCRRLPK